MIGWETPYQCTVHIVYQSCTHWQGIVHCKCYHGCVHYVPGPWYLIGNAPPPPPKGPLSISY